MDDEIDGDVGVSIFDAVDFDGVKVLLDFRSEPFD